MLLRSTPVTRQTLLDVGTTRSETVAPFVTEIPVFFANEAAEINFLVERVKAAFGNVLVVLEVIVLSVLVTALNIFGLKIIVGFGEE